MAGKFTEELANQWVVSYQQLGAVSFACDAVGISKGTFYDWMHRGEAGEEPYEAFYFRARRARAEAAGKLIRIATDDKGGAMFLLERLFPAEFGPMGRSFQDAMQTIIDSVLPRLTDAAAREVIDALASIQRERLGVGESGVAGIEAGGTSPAVIDADGVSVVGALPTSTEPDR